MLLLLPVLPLLPGSGRLGQARWHCPTTAAAAMHLPHQLHALLLLLLLLLPCWLIRPAPVLP